MKRLIPVGAVAALLVAAPGASAAVDLGGGSTRLTLDSGTAAALESLGVSVSTTGHRASLRGARATFPITGGSIDSRTAAGRIEHRGGLRLRGGGNAITLRNLTVRVARRITVSAQVGGARVNVLNLTGRPRVTRSGFNTNVAGLTARLTGAAAAALNGAFAVDAFAAGAVLGRVRVAAEPTEVELRRSGATSVALDAGTLQAIVGLGVTPGIVGPATLDGTTASFPITGGRADLDLGGGVARHSGGVSLTAGSVVVELTDFDIRLGETPQLFASINGSDEKAAILDLDLSTAEAPAIEGRTVTLAGVTARLTQGAADALNGAFGTTAITAGLTFGVATVVTTAR